MPKNDEQDLIRRAQQRDADAFSELYRRHVDQIYRYVLARVGDRSTAEDLTSEVFVRTLEGLDGYEQRGTPLISWLYRIANARVIDHWRAGKRHDALIDSRTIEDSIEMPRGDVIAYEELARSLKKLTREQQEVIILKFVEGYSISDIAQLTGRGKGAVKSLQHRALASLARIINHD